MALIKCPECGREISDKATACIHCGFPIEHNAFCTDGQNVNCIINGKTVDCSFLFRDDLDFELKTLCMMDDTDLSCDIINKIVVEWCKQGYVPEVFNGETSVEEEERKKKEREYKQKYFPDTSQLYTPKCPKCGCTNIQIVRRNWSFFGGFATNKTDRVCAKCNYKW